MSVNTANQPKKTMTISVTQARKDFFNLLDLVEHKNHEVHLEKNGVHVATIKPAFDQARIARLKKSLKELQAGMPILTDEDVEEYKRIHEEGWGDRFPEW